MNRMGFAARSIALLEEAARRAPDQELKGRATFALFESYLDTGDWQRAEASFPAAAQRLTSQEWPEWHAHIAILAVRAGAREDALRIWKRVARDDPRSRGTGQSRSEEGVDRVLRGEGKRGARV